MRTERFKRQTLALFFIVSVIPALIVGAVWYVYTQTSTLNFLFLDFNSFVLPVIFVGIIPAVILSFVFAELLFAPIREIHLAVRKLARGDYSPKFTHHSSGEFSEIGASLDLVAAKLQQTLSEASSETELIRAERGKLNSVLNSMSDGVFALDRDGRIVLFNKAACEITGRSIGEVAGQLADRVLPFRHDGEQSLSHWLKLGDESTNNGRPTSLELYHADGHSLTVKAEAVMLKADPNGIAALITVHDLTKAHQLEEMKIDFVALAAHELRTPLTEIKGYLDILSMEAKGLTKPQKAFLAQAVSSAAELGGLMHNLLNVARIEHGEISYQPERIDYLQFVENAIGPIRERAVLQGRKFETILPAGPLPILGDPMGLTEVIANLVSNAIKNTASKGTISLEIKVHRTSIDTIVTDDGIGIPAQALPQLFSKFFRVSELKSTTRGTGLGLYICRSIIEAHNGHIFASSDFGHGSTFTFILPRQTIATTSNHADNKTTITRGAHGWIKNHSVR